MMDCLCRPSRIMSVRINLLDETDFIHEIKDDLPGQALLDVVFARLNLIETSYFGIRYIDEENQTHWLDPASRISRQLKPKADPYDLYFGVKFYAADPCKLLEEITRYQLFLQVKQDVLQGRLPVAFELAAELGAFVVQSELGDYDQRRHSKGYVSEFRLLPNQSSELETRVAELHQQLKGMSPATAELNYLDKVKWHDMYGVDLHPVLGEDSVEYFLGLTPSGIVVLRNKTTVAHYYWPRIAKVYYKGRYFMLRISDKNKELSTYGFETPRKSACKHLWRCCVEHHAFFRLVRVAPLPNSQSNASELFQMGTRLRYSGRSTEKQSIKDALSIGRTPPAFTRVPSKRQPRRVIDDFLNGVGVGGNGGKPAETYSNVGTLLGGKGGAGIMTTNYESPYRSTYSIPTSLGIRPYQQQPLGTTTSHQTANGNYGGGTSNLQTPDSPRSTRSAPWPRSQQRSLFGNNPSSPRSVRSARTARASSGGSKSNHHQSSHHHGQHQHHHHSHQGEQQSRSQTDSHVPSQRYRSSSVESHSSNDSRSTRRHKNRHRRNSDNESELSRGSGRSGRSHHRKHRRSRHRHESAGSDHESTRGRSYSGHRSSSVRSGSAELIDSTSQWREVQRRQAEASLGQSSVQQAAVSKSSMVARSLHSNDSHSDTHSHHKSRHRHRSKNKSPSDSRSRIWSSELAKHLQFDLVDTAGMSEDQLREIPYTVVETNSKRSNSNLKIHKSNSKSSVGGKSTGSGNTLTNGSGSMKGQGKIRVDRIRGLYYQNANPTENTTTKNGSIRSASTISSRECERNSGLVRMMSSMSMGDFISPTGSNLSPLENSALRVSHEHTDSGLGADQDYAYSSERSSDSTRYGTNKSSGASSGSHRKAAGGAGSTSTAFNSLMQQSVSNQQHQQQKPLNHRQNAHSYFGSQRAHHKANPSSAKTLTPIHNILAASQSTVPQAAQSQQTSSPSPMPPPAPTTNQSLGSRHATDPKKGSAGNRLLNYTTFENNQYKFSLNNVFGKSAASSGKGGGNANSNGDGGLGRLNNHIDSFPEWPNTPAAPYYYNGPSSSSANFKKRDAKSDIGVRTRRLSGGQHGSMGPGPTAITKTQLLSGHYGNGGNGAAGCYPLNGPDAYTNRWQGGVGGGGMHPAKSDLFLSYLHTGPQGGGEYERPYIYNYKMPQMPDFMPPPPPQQSNSAYHISGAQTADPPQLYKPADAGGSVPVSSGGSSSGIFGGATPANDVMYYQFDNSRPPIVQQPKSLLGGKASSSGPLVFVQHGQNVSPANVTATQQTSTNSTGSKAGNTTTATTASTNTTKANGTTNNNGFDEPPSPDSLLNDDEEVVHYVDAVDNERPDDDDDDDADYAEFDDGFRVEDPNFSVNRNGNNNTTNNNDTSYQRATHQSADNNNGSISNASSIEQLAQSPSGIPVAGALLQPSRRASSASASTSASSSTSSSSASGSRHGQVEGIDNCNRYANGNPSSAAATEQQYQRHGTINHPNSSSTRATASPPTFCNPPVAVANSNNQNALNANTNTLNRQQQLQQQHHQQQQQQQQTNQNYYHNSNRNNITVDHTQNPNANAYPFTHTNSINTMNNTTTTTITTNNSNAMPNQNPNISSSLEIILSPIIQSSRRAQ